MKRDRIHSELMEIQGQNTEGLLVPCEVVAWAEENPDSELYGQFEWDDTEAARKYRIDQARQIIRINVEVLESDNTPFRAFVSLRDDRKRVGGGYRGTLNVMSDEKLRLQLLSEARVEMRTFQAKYRRLTELGKVFDAMRAVEEAISVEDELQPV